MLCFHSHIFLLKLYVSVRGYQPTLNYLFRIHADVDALGSVVDMYSVPSLKYFCRVSELEELTHQTLAYSHCPT